MNKIFEIASAFYGVLIPKRDQKSFLNLVIDYLNQRYSIETAIGMALRELHLN
ncbi:MAG: hypothetical protein HYS25_06520 [Ignavibacteriales bacterium]|nr:hypothetical protein [Ignavibacteriales bacterium]